MGKIAVSFLNTIYDIIFNIYISGSLHQKQDVDEDATLHKEGHSAFETFEKFTQSGGDHP
jgi:hypothetical protein